MSEPKTIEIHQIKTAGYSTYHADGAIGGMTPTGMVYLSFYLDRSAIPQKITYEVKADGSFGDVKEVEGKRGIIREVQCGIVMNLAVAEDMLTFMEKVVKQLKQTKV